MKDLLNQDVLPGCVIAYATPSKSAPTMQWGLVMNVGPSKGYGTHNVVNLKIISQRWTNVNGKYQYVPTILGSHIDAHDGRAVVIPPEMYTKEMREFVDSIKS